MNIELTCMFEKKDVAPKQNKTKKIDLHLIILIDISLPFFVVVLCQD